jgi:tetratricopeptide (TPR) repeat protein
MYFFTAGELTSRTFRRVAVGLPTYSEPIDKKDLPKSVRDLAWKMGAIETADDFAEQGRFAEALGALSALPPELRKDKLVLIRRLGIALQAGDDEYKKAIALFEKHRPNDPALLLVSVDGLMMTREYAKALAAVDRLDKVVGGDPYLDVVRSSVHLEAGNAEKAETFAASAVRRESSLEQAHWNLVTVRLERKDFAGVVRALTEMEKALDCEVEGLEEDETYAEFAKTREYREWLESRKGKKTSPVDTAPVE